MHNQTFTRLLVIGLASLNLAVLPESASAQTRGRETCHSQCRGDPLCITACNEAAEERRNNNGRPTFPGSNVPQGEQDWRKEAFRDGGAGGGGGNGR
jgi:hypothetical protein